MYSDKLYFLRKDLEESLKEAIKKHGVNSQFISEKCIKIDDCYEIVVNYDDNVCLLRDGYWYDLFNQNFIALDELCEITDNLIYKKKRA